MTSINFRLYGEKIYGLISKYLTEYINPEICKEKFITNFKNGIISLNIDKIKKPISINIFPILLIKGLKIEKIELTIPDEKTNFILRLSKSKIMFEIIELDEKQIESLIIKERKYLIENFIKETINIIVKNETSSFFQGLPGYFVKRALDKFAVELNDIKIFLKCDKYLFLLEIEKIIYNKKVGIKVNNIKFVVSKNDIVKKFNIEIAFNDNDNKDDKNPNELKINISDLYFEINSNIYTAIMYTINKFNNISYKKIYIRYKKLIDFRKPIKSNDKKVYYPQLMFWAIKTVIKLLKYKRRKILYIFDLIKTTQIKLSKKYINSNIMIENNNITNNDNDKLINNYLILPEELILLESTKDKVVSLLIENKNRNKNIKGFKNYFGEREKDSNENELTEDEKQTLNRAYERTNIINYLLNKRKININNILEEDKKEEQIIEKIKNYFNNISLNITLSKIELLLNNIYSNHSVYLNNFNAIINKKKEQLNYQFSLEDIRYDEKNSILKNIIEGKEAIKFNKNNDIYEIIFNFKNLEINYNLVIYIINFYYSLVNTNIIKENENKIFAKQNYKQMTNNKNKIISLINNIKINKIPTLNLIDDTKKVGIFVGIINFMINKTSIYFKINIKDNYSNIIIDNYEIKIIKNEENTKFDLTFNNQLKMVFPVKITECIFISFWKITKLKHYYQIQQKNLNDSQNNNNALLYKFEYNHNENIERKEELINKLDVNISIKDLSLEIEEEYGKTNISLINLLLTYNINKSFLFKLQSLNIALNTTPLFLYMINLHLKAFNIKKYEIALLEEMKKEFNLDLNQVLFALLKKNI